MPKASRATAVPAVAFIAVVGGVALALVGSGAADDTADEPPATEESPATAQAPASSAEAPQPALAIRPAGVRVLVVPSDAGVRVADIAEGRTRLDPGSALAAGVGTETMVNVGSNERDETVTRVLVADAATSETRFVGGVPGAWTLPASVPGAALEGISWDGSRVVLENLDDPGHLAAVTVGDPQAEPVIVRPKGRFAFDAISTDGNTLFLTQYARPNGEQVYQIRAVDLRTGTLLPDPVVDKADGGTTMTGDPFARATTRDFAYTLYVGGSEPFVHALATTGEIYSLCLDLPERANDLAAKSAWSVAVSRDGTTVVAANGILGSAYAFQEHGAVVSIPLAGRLESPPPLAVESSAVAYVKTEAGVERLDLAARSTQPYSTTAPVYGLLATDDGVLALGGDSVPLGLIEGH